MKITKRLVWEVTSTTVMAGAALAMLGFHIYDRSVAPAPRGAQRDVKHWEAWEASALRLGAEDGSMTVSAFMDFTCPFCGMLAPVLDSLIAEFPGSVAIDFLHFPIVGHQFAIPSAIAAECADQQGVFPAMYRTPFRLVELAALCDRGGVAINSASDAPLLRGRKDLQQ
jgi:thioredoxin family protein